MKFFSEVVTVIVSLFFITILFWPWMIGAVDLLGIFFVDHQVTSINWSSGKVFFSIIYPWFIGMAIISIGCV
jgi:hypothetical protein